MLALAREYFALNGCAICRQNAGVLTASIHVSQTMHARVIAGSVIASEAKQSRPWVLAGRDCFVAHASRACPTCAYLLADLG
jgi:hypothetical protein